MSNEYRLCYTEFDAREKQYWEACAIPYGPKALSPQEQRYFYAVLGKKGTRRRVCFIKLQNGENRIDKERGKSERLSGGISSPYVVARFRQGELHNLEMQWRNGNKWTALPGRVLLFEYLPTDLEHFWREQARSAHSSRLNHNRGQILVKLIEAVGHLNQGQLFHCDIKPLNIMINCHGLCGEAKWHCEELDVKLTDFDSAQDGRVAGTQFYTGTHPFQPVWPHEASTWLDLYSICMVALWLYCGEDGRDTELLEALSKQPRASVEEICAVLQNGPFPDSFLKQVGPTLLHSTQGMSGGAPQRTPSEELSDLSDRLLNYFFGSTSAKPMELLEPSQKQRGWSVILRVDQDYWPIFGQGREYRVLSFSGYAGDSGKPLSFEEEWLHELYTERMTAESGPHEEVLSAPPEICVAYEGQGSFQEPPSVKAGIYGSVQQEDKQTFKAQCLAEQRGIPRGGSALLYQGKNPLHTREQGFFFHTVHVHSVDFYEDPPPEPLPVYPGRQAREGAEVNVVLLVPVFENTRDRNFSSFIAQAVNQGAASEKYRPYYYGLTILRKPEETVYLSFCNGKQGAMGEEIVKDFYMTSKGRVYREEVDWNRSGKDRLAFSPKRPTAVIFFLDRMLSPRELEELGGELAEVSGHPLYAVDHLQVFLPAKETEAGVPAWESEWEATLRVLHAALRPGGAFVVTPLQKGGVFDREIRWPKDLCQRGRYTG